MDKTAVYNRLVGLLEASGASWPNDSPVALLDGEWSQVLDVLWPDIESMLDLLQWVRTNYGLFQIFQEEVDENLDGWFKRFEEGQVTPD